MYNVTVPSASFNAAAKDDTILAAIGKACNGVLDFNSTATRPNLSLANVVDLKLDWVTWTGYAYGYSGNTDFALTANPTDSFVFCKSENNSSKKQPLPPGWRAAWDSNYSRYYFISPENVTTWYDPRLPAPSSQPSVPTASPVIEEHHVMYDATPVDQSPPPVLDGGLTMSPVGVTLPRDDELKQGTLPLPEGDGAKDAPVPPKRISTMLLAKQGTMSSFKSVEEKEVKNAVLAAAAAVAEKKESARSSVALGGHGRMSTLEPLKDGSGYSEKERNVNEVPGGAEESAPTYLVNDYVSLHGMNPEGRKSTPSMIADHNPHMQTATSRSSMVSPPPPPPVPINDPRLSYASQPAIDPRMSYASQPAVDPRMSVPYASQSVLDPRVSYASQPALDPRMSATYASQGALDPRMSYASQSAIDPRMSYASHHSVAADPRMSYVPAATVADPRMSYLPPPPPPPATAAVDPRMSYVPPPPPLAVADQRMSYNPYAGALPPPPPAASASQGQLSMQYSASALPPPPPMAPQPVQQQIAYPPLQSNQQHHIPYPPPIATGYAAAPTGGDTLQHQHQIQPSGTMRSESTHGVSPVHATTDVTPMLTVQTQCHVPTPTAASPSTPSPSHKEKKGKKSKKESGDHNSTVVTNVKVVNGDDADKRYCGCFKTKRGCCAFWWISTVIVILGLCALYWFVFFPKFDVAIVNSHSAQLEQRGYINNATRDKPYGVGFNMTVNVTVLSFNNFDYTLDAVEYRSTLLDLNGAFYGPVTTMEVRNAVSTRQKNITLSFNFRIMYNVTVPSVSFQSAAKDDTILTAIGRACGILDDTMFGSRPALSLSNSVNLRLDWLTWTNYAFRYNGNTDFACINV
ncbi:hypothetical protein HDU97_008950 [Phlyctochytrium planicorne]|nr:hypothetical protein HDU97_008950 [Phlyctochytrium planicorne]